MGRLAGVVDGLLYPILTTTASLLPRRLGRLIRRDDAQQHTEADPIG